MIGVSDYGRRMKHEGYDKANNIMIAGDGSVTFDCAPDFPSTIILGAHEVQRADRCSSAAFCPLSAVRCPLVFSSFHTSHTSTREVCL
jgi:hypothetical protein